MALQQPRFLIDPPPGEVRTLENPPFSGGGVMAAGIATTVIAATCVGLRIFTRVHVVSGDLGWDDCLVLFALAFSVAFFFAGRHLYTVGAGRHMWDIPYSDYSPAFLQTTVAATLTYAVSISFSKLSILAFYLRVSPNQGFRRCVYALIGVVCAYTVTYILVIVFRCAPVAAGWDLDVLYDPAAHASCIEYLVPMMVLSIANIVIDLVILFLPVKVIVPLQIPVRQKLSLTFLFATGGFVCAAAIKRTIIMPPLLASSDYAWDLPEQFIWSFVEVNAGLVCASLAALKPLFMRYIPFLITSRLRSSHASSAGLEHGGSSGSANKASAAAGHPVYAARGEAYELPRRDDQGHSTSDDDEAHLWCRKDGPAGAVAASPHRGSAGSLAELYPGASPPVYAVSADPCGGHASKSTEGVNITKETHVTYGK